LISVKPVDKYEPPKIPTVEEISSNPAPLKKLPSRWKKCTAIIAGVGILSISALSAYYTSSRGYNNGRSHVFGIFNSHTQLDLTTRLHHGGRGAATYVVHLTEQEAFGLIRMQLEAVGLNFAHQPPPYTTQGVWLGEYIGLDLFDYERGVAVSHISWEDSHTPYARRGHRLAESVADGFAEQTGLSVGVFYNPGVFPWREFDDERLQRSNRLTRRQTAATRSILEARLTAQVEEFISYLRDKDIL